MDWRELLMVKILRLIRRLRITQTTLFKGSTHPFVDFFKGLEKVEAVKHIFGEKTEEVLRNLKVEFTWIGGYMWVSNVDGHLMVSSRYLNTGDKMDIYLDLIHELVHVRQFMEGKELFDSDYNYAERPTEVEAYRHAVKEARRLRLSDERICRYLKTEWMNDDDLRLLAKTLDVKCR
jgi:hypothetical protein